MLNLQLLLANKKILKDLIKIVKSDQAFRPFLSHIVSQNPTVKKSKKLHKYQITLIHKNEKMVNSLLKITVKKSSLNMQIEKKVIIGAVSSQFLILSLYSFKRKL